MLKTLEARKKMASTVAEILKNNYKNAKTELSFENEYQLVVAVMLSAQTTDKKVNQITPAFYKKYPDWLSLSTASLSDVQNAIYGVNFHIGKADRLIKAANVMIHEFNGVLPKTIKELIKIPGIARKSANVILQELWDIAEGIVVDTHMTRVANRLHLTDKVDPVKIEDDLMECVPKEYWRNFSSAMVLHGRYVCVARKPKCDTCVLNKICPSAFLDIK